MIPIELDDFVARVGDEVRRRARTGVVAVRFSQRGLTPATVRATRQDVPRREVPEVGDLVALPRAGYLGRDATWLVDEVIWEGAATAALVVCVDPIVTAARP